MGLSERRVFKSSSASGIHGIQNMCFVMAGLVPAIHVFA
ncbi:hypothetical protein OCAR_5614 [Afipia carboxidovorans OM5]|nr:hypothetical protein OCAR_5614 [Afipia carboxidovorans OM5]